MNRLDRRAERRPAHHGPQASIEVDRDLRAVASSWRPPAERFGRRAGHDQVRFEALDPQRTRVTVIVEPADGQDPAAEVADEAVQAASARMAAHLRRFKDWMERAEVAADAARTSSQQPPDAMGGTVNP